MSAELKYWFLRDHQLFRNLSFSEIDGLCILQRFKKSKKHELVNLPYSEKERVYFLKQGTLKFFRITEDGEEVLLDIIQKGDLFGELDFGQPLHDDTFLQVVSDEAILCTFFRENLEAVMLKKPGFALNYIKFIGFNFKKLQNSYKNIFFKDAKTRFILLLHTIIEKEAVTQQAFMLPNYLTQKDIAQLICTTRQTVISLLQELTKEGLLEYSQKEIFIPDVQKIRNFVRNVK
jgi:CRP/FNR family transcriptional regulator